jgi:hypothetical protein
MASGGIAVGIEQWDNVLAERHCFGQYTCFFGFNRIMFAAVNDEYYK